MNPDNTDKASIGVVARVASVLRALAEAPSGMSLGQIARRSGLARSTVQRLVSALASEGLVVTSGGAGQIGLGPELLRLSAALLADMPTRLRAQIRLLSGELGETVDLSVVRYDQVVFLDQVPGVQRLLAVSHIGAAFPLHCCASGKAYLAKLSDREVQERIGQTYDRRTAFTRTTFEELARDLAAIRRTGIAIDDQEHTEGISALGIGVGNVGESWFGISVPMPSQRFIENKSGFVRRLLEFQHANTY
ncbi:MAG: IclR family transcriptional regulator [Proteobacteria bacterium]|nr:IclR family transcriptional regulator [Pseudomonadota bacterium]